MTNATPKARSAGFPQPDGSSSGSPPPRRIFWTGGWDSTFRVLDLVLHYGETVEPWYVRDENRQSIGQELAVMDRLRLAINERATGGRLLALQVLHAAAARPDPVLQKKFEKLQETRGIGPQYIWLAELVRQNALEGIEVCVQHNEDFYFLDPRLNSGIREYKREPVRPYLDEEAPESLFNLFSFPTLHIGKAEMREHARDHGFLDLLEQTWFCHMPTRAGQPCGFCVPCRMTISKGVGYRLPWRSRLNNRIARMLEFLPRGYRAKRWARLKLRGY
ncbi:MULTISPECIES: hypothetical protein [Thioalkalivibrio]|uniref:hypothetical protein n=1 Tax=Thioalkalivibrio TaxID=106633 RepID=UPI001E3E97FE|nr:MULTISPECIES: hypothetical protein [Thioalkalivibrio]